MLSCGEPANCFRTPAVVSGGALARQCATDAVDHVRYQEPGCGAIRHSPFAEACRNEYLRVADLVANKRRAVN